MALSRHRMATSQRAQSQRRIWFRVLNNESGYGKEIRREEILLEPENITNNENQEEKKEITG